MNQNITIPIKELERRFANVITRLPVIAGNEVVNFALSNFKVKGFQGNPMQPWKPKLPSKWGIKTKGGRSLLVKSGRLRRSIRITQLSNAMVTIGTDVPYAKVHNEGFRGAVVQSVKSYSRTKNYHDETSAPGAKSVKFTKTKIGEIQVSEHKRTIKQNIPARPFLKESQYLTAKLKRVLTAEIMKALR